jgi:hypothetical protein
MSLDAQYYSRFFAKEFLLLGWRPCIWKWRSWSWEGQLGLAVIPPSSVGRVLASKLFSFESSL